MRKRQRERERDRPYIPSSSSLSRTIALVKGGIMFASHPPYACTINVRVGSKPGGLDRPSCPGKRERERSHFGSSASAQDRAATTLPRGSLSLSSLFPCFRGQQVSTRGLANLVGASLSHQRARREGLECAPRRGVPGPRHSRDCSRG